MPRKARASAGGIGGPLREPGQLGGALDQFGVAGDGRPRAKVSVSSMPTRRWPPAPSGPNITGNAVRPMPVAEQVVPAGNPAAAATSVSASPACHPARP